MAFTLPPCPTITTPWSRTSTSRRCGFITTSITATYVTNLNAALEPHADLQKKSVEELIANIDAAP